MKSTTEDKLVSGLLSKLMRALSSKHERLPVVASYGAYALVFVWATICCILIAQHASRFSSVMEMAWMVSTSVAVTQEMIILHIAALLLLAMVKTMFRPVSRDSTSSPNQLHSIAPAASP